MKNKTKSASLNYVTRDNFIVAAQQIFLEITKCKEEDNGLTLIAFNHHNYIKYRGGGALDAKWSVYFHIAKGATGTGSTPDMAYKNALALLSSYKISEASTESIWE